METFFLFCLLIIHGGFATNTRVHVLVSSSKTWVEAQSYCRQKYKDLSTVSSIDEYGRLQKMLGASYNHAWIGMYRNNSNLDQFIWSDGDLLTNYTCWKKNQPDGRQNNQYCVEVDGTGWADYGCQNSLNFFCYSMTLVRDNKTWEEAMEHCRQHYVDLATLTSDQQVQQAENNLKSEVSVWVGLRFIAGQWYWLNAAGMEVLLPGCPTAPYRCGALNIMTEQWENRDCEEKLSFFCF